MTPFDSFDSAQDGSAQGKPPGKIVLVVDDDDSIRDLMEFIMRREGFSVEKAVDGKDALEQIDKLPPDIILLDLMMPRYGGFEVLRKLQSGAHARIPIIVISGRFADKATVDMIRQESNVVEFLEKPIRPPQLLAVVQRVMQPRPGAAGGA